MLSSEPEKGFAYEKADFLGNSGLLLQENPTNSGAKLLRYLDAGYLCGVALRQTEKEKRDDRRGAAENFDGRREIRRILLVVRLAAEKHKGTESETLPWEGSAIPLRRTGGAFPCSKC